METHITYCFGNKSDGVIEDHLTESTAIIAATRIHFIQSCIYPYFEMTLLQIIQVTL